jgi:molybdate transport system substrate-binding protein
VRAARPAPNLTMVARTAGLDKIRDQLKYGTCAGDMSSIAGDLNHIHVMSGGAPKEVFALLAPKFEQQAGIKVKFTYAVITELREKLGAGATADVLVLPTPVLDSLAKDGKVRADSRTAFGTVGVSVGVKEGAPRPDISSKERFRDAMLAARSVVHATPRKRRRAALTWVR